MPDSGGFAYMRPGHEREAAAATDPQAKVEPPEESSSDTYPDDATVAEVKDWVGDDPDRAKDALAAERKRANPRVTLVEYLQDRQST